MFWKPVALSLFACFALAPTPMVAQDIGVPDTGAAPEFNFSWDTLSLTRPSGETIELRTRDLENLDQVSFTTSTMWTDGIKTFTGPTLMSVLKAANITSRKIEMKPYNDYIVDAVVEAPAITEEYPIIATRIDGEHFNIDQKGPFWIIYPYDSDPRLTEEPYPGLSIWQLVHITGLK